MFNQLIQHLGTNNLDAIYPTIDVFFSKDHYEIDTAGNNILHCLAQHASKKIFSNLIEYIFERYEKKAFDLTLTANAKMQIPVIVRQQLNLPNDQSFYQLFEKTRSASNKLWEPILVRGELEILEMNAIDLHNKPILKENLLEAKKAGDEVIKLVPRSCNKPNSEPELARKIDNQRQAINGIVHQYQHNKVKKHIFFDKDIAYFSKELGFENLLQQQQHRLIQSTTPFFDFIFFYETIDKTIANQQGNCGEQAFIVSTLLNINKRKSIVYSNGNHGIVVYDHAADWNPKDYRTWGENAVVVDTWSRCIYPAYLIPKYFLNCQGIATETEAYYLLYYYNYDYSSFSIGVTNESLTFLTQYPSFRDYINNADLVQFQALLQTGKKMMDSMPTKAKTLRFLQASHLAINNDYKEQLQLLPTPTLENLTLIKKRFVDCSTVYWNYLRKENSVRTLNKFEQFINSFLTTAVPKEGKENLMELQG